MSAKHQQGLLGACRQTIHNTHAPGSFVLMQPASSWGCSCWSIPTWGLLSCWSVRHWDFSLSNFNSVVIKTIFSRTEYITSKQNWVVFRENTDRVGWETKKKKKQAHDMKEKNIVLFNLKKLITAILLSVLCFKAFAALYIHTYTAKYN